MQIVALILMFVFGAESATQSEHLCIFAHGLGLDWHNHEEGIHNLEKEEYLWSGHEPDPVWEGPSWNGTVSNLETYWLGLPHEMKKRGICENVFLIKFDTVGSSLDEFHKYEDEFCNLVNSHDTIIFAHSMGNYITGNMKCIGNVTHFKLFQSPRLGNRMMTSYDHFFVLVIH